LIVGHSVQQRLLVVSFTERQPRTRIISAREATTHERQDYEENGPKPRCEVDDVRPEYQFDYSQAKPNRFASRLKRPVVAVVLESDVAAVFDSSAKVNAQLRSAISARKHRKPVTRARTHHRRAG
jgi:hypothetical protein